MLEKFTNQLRMSANGIPPGMIDERVSFLCAPGSDLLHRRLLPLASAGLYLSNRHLKRWYLTTTSCPLPCTVDR